jgi:cytochrome c oxidase subunit 3
MANTATLTTDSKQTWGGGKSPFSVSYGKLMMWIFLLSDAFTFSSLLVAYGFVRFTFTSTLPNTIVKPFAHLSHSFVEEMHKAGLFVTERWPSPELVFNHFPFLHGIHLPLMFVSLMTFILIASSVTMVLAVEAGHRMAKKEVEMYMILTIIGGAAFLGCQAWEWTNFITEGASLSGNPFGPTAFAALFFIVTGFHGTHVLSGVILNIIIYINVVKGTYEKRGHYEMVEKVGLYWHFVDLVWVFVFTFFYLI